MTACSSRGALLQPWGFEPGQVRARTLLIYGAEDHLVEPRHGRWWRSRLPDARYEEVPRVGHLVITSRWARVLAHLAPGAPNSLSE